MMAKTGAYPTDLAVVGLTMMWLYLISVSMLTGAVVNHSLAVVRARPATASGEGRDHLTPTR